MYYFRCANAFQWTPTQVDEQPAALVDWLLRINDEKVAFENEQYRDAADESKQQQGTGR
jgi:hypothetical protein